MKQTQGRTLIAHLKRKPMTSMQITMLGVSLCWWKRVAECLRQDERLVKRERKDGLLVYSVRRVC